MPVLVKCTCGKQYTLTDEYAGQALRCTACGSVVQVPALSATSSSTGADVAFDRDKFFLRQKAMSLSEKYFVWDENQRQLLFVERPTHLGRGCLGLFLGGIAGIIVGGGIIALVIAFGGENVPDFVGTAALFLGIFTMLFVTTIIHPKRHVSFYRDEAKGEKLLEILQDSKYQFMNVTYTIRDGAGTVIALLKKNVFTNILRKRWLCTTPDGAGICHAVEDSPVKALLRRVLGPLFGLLRTNFIITDGNGVQILGEFNRTMSIMDRYVLDMSRDTSRHVDRRIALAIGVMLDTAEKR